MQTSLRTNTSSPMKLKKYQRELCHIFSMSTALADATETLLEELGMYQEQFLRGLNQSIKEAQQGKTRQIKSLADLDV